MEWSCSHTKEPMWWPHRQNRWSQKTTIRLRPTMVALSLSWVSGPPHKTELSHPYWDLHITFSSIKFYNYLKEFFFGIFFVLYVWLSHGVSLEFALLFILCLSRLRVINTYSYPSRQQKGGQWYDPTHQHWCGSQDVKHPTLHIKINVKKKVIAKSIARKNNYDIQKNIRGRYYRATRAITW